MRHTAVVTLVGTAALCLGLAGCAGTDHSKDQAAQEPPAREVPVIPDETSAAQEMAQSDAAGEVQERGVSRLLPGVTAGTAVLRPLSTNFTSAYPGEFAFRTQQGYYLTAINGGGRTGDPTVITSATSAGAWEKFTIGIAAPPSPYDKLFQTATGNYSKGNFLTAVGARVVGTRTPSTATPGRFKPGNSSASSSVAIRGPATSMASWLPTASFSLPQPIKGKPGLASTAIPANQR